jgi:protein TonB
MVPALEAVLRWRFEVPGATSRLLMTVTVNFSLDNTPKTGAGEAPKEASPEGTRPLPAGWPSNALRVGDNIKPPVKVLDVKPLYPDVAEKARVQGVVIVETLIGPDGKVQDARILRSIPLLDQAALDAVRQWVFTPTLLNGVPVPVVMTVTVNFTLQ